MSTTATTPIAAPGTTLASPPARKSWNPELRPGQTLLPITGLWPEVGGDQIERMRFKDQRNNTAYTIVCTASDDPKQPEYEVFARPIAVPAGTNSAIQRRVAGLFSRASEKIDEATGVKRITMNFTDPVTKQRFVLFYRGHMPDQRPESPTWQVSLDTAHSANQLKLHRPAALGTAAPTAPSKPAEEDAKLAASGVESEALIGDADLNADLGEVSGDDIPF